MVSNILERLRKAVDENCIKVRINCDGADIGWPLAVDVEHNEQGDMVCIGMYDHSTREAHIHTSITPFVKDVLEKADLIMHNGVSDIECLRTWGVRILDCQLVHDTMLLGHIIDSSLKSYGLKDMAKRELGIEYPSYDEIVGKHKGKCNKQPACDCTRVTLDKQPIELVSLYNALDCWATFKLYEKQRGRIENGKGL